MDKSDKLSIFYTKSSSSITLKKKTFCHTDKNEENIKLSNSPKTDEITNSNGDNSPKSPIFFISISERKKREKEMANEMTKKVSTKKSTDLKEFKNSPKDQNHKNNQKKKVEKTFPRNAKKSTVKHEENDRKESFLPSSQLNLSKSDSKKERNRKKREKRFLTRAQKKKANGKEQENLADKNHLEKDKIEEYQNDSINFKKAEKQSDKKSRKKRGKRTRGGKDKINGTEETFQQRNPLFIEFSKKDWKDDIWNKLKRKNLLKTKNNKSDNSKKQSRKRNKENRNVQSISDSDKIDNQVISWKIDKNPGLDSINVHYESFLRIYQNEEYLANIFNTLKICPHP